MPGPRERPRILVLGGTGDGLALARALASRGYPLIYSVKGLTRITPESFMVRSGGFGGGAGLSRFLAEEGVELVVDATHPYADTISRHALAAAHGFGVPCWALRRPPWLAGPGDDWREICDWRELMRLLQPFKRPLFTIGSEPLVRMAERPDHQHWLVRGLAPATAPEGVTLVTARGPFAPADEMRLMRHHRVDALVSKNSGGSAVVAKLRAARALRIPVFMLIRPSLPKADREFRTLDSMIMDLERSATVE